MNCLNSVYNLNKGVKWEVENGIRYRVVLSCVFREIVFLKLKILFITSFLNSKL